LKKVAKFTSSLGCLFAVVAPLTALMLYPKANWLFAFVLVGIAILVLNVLLAKDPAPPDLADQIERLLNGNYGGWDVDDFEHQRIRDRRLKNLWQGSMQVGGPPEEWVRLNEDSKNQLREIIRSLREFDQ
jgi:hypothetical protein